MKILVTGVAGFIGSNLADRLLEEGHRVVGIDNLSYGLRENIPDGVEFHLLDIRDKGIYSLFRDVDTVFHLAAKNCIADCQDDPVETADINVRGTVNVFEAARQGKVNKVVYAESSAMYEGSSVLPTPESEVKPESFYAVSKLATMYFADAYARFYGKRIVDDGCQMADENRKQKTENRWQITDNRSRISDNNTKETASSNIHHPISGGLKFTALRYFCVYGPVQDYRRTIPPVMSAFIIKLLKGEQPIIYGTGEKKRDFVYVDDINDFHMMCLTDKQTDGHVYNLGAGVNYSVNDIFQMVSRLLNIYIEPKRMSDLPGEAQITLADITEAKKLGWAPKTDIQTGLVNAIKYIKSEMGKGKIP
jgi:nucleoside-diphosphate-sugar epimerase